MYKKLNMNGHVIFTSSFLVNLNLLTHSIYFLLFKVRPQSPVARRLQQNIRHLQNLRVRQRKPAQIPPEPVRRGPGSPQGPRHRQCRPPVWSSRAEGARKRARLAVPRHNPGRERTRRPGHTSPATLPRNTARQSNGAQHTRHLLHERVDAAAGLLQLDQVAQVPSRLLAPAQGRRASCQTARCIWDHERDRHSVLYGHSKRCSCVSTLIKKRKVFCIFIFF